MDDVESERCHAAGNGDVGSEGDYLPSSGPFPVAVI
jgi:hypothetical protein